MSKVVLLALVALALIPSASPARGSVSGAACQEDAACWNWASMGDHRRAVVTIYGTSRVVSPCAYQRLDRASLVDHVRTPRLRGDALASRYPCNRRAPHNPPLT